MRSVAAVLVLVALSAASAHADALADSTRLRQEGNEATLAMRYSDALQLYQRALAAAPDQVGLHYSLARAHQFLGEYPEALAELQRFVDEAPREAKAKVGKLDELFAQLRPRVSKLQLTCNIKGARVLVRDRVIGTTPLPPTALPSGATTIQLELEGFFPATREVVLPGGGTLAIEVALEPKSTRGLVTIHTTPLAADISVDGKSVGTTTPKVELALPAGAHDVFASKPGYRDAKVPIVLAAGAVREVVIPMQKTLPVYQRWWFWTTLGLVVAGGAGLAVAFTTERGASRGSLPPGQVSAP